MPNLEVTVWMVLEEFAKIDFPEDFLKSQVQMGMAYMDWPQRTLENYVFFLDHTVPNLQTKM